MSDLKEELMHMAVDGANEARPLALAEVVRRGDRRRARTIGQRSIGGLSVLSISAAVIVGGAFHPLHGAPNHPVSGAAAGVTTLTETSANSAGTLTVQVRYRTAPHDKVKILSATFTGTTTASMRTVHVGALLRPSLQSKPDASCIFHFGFLAFVRQHKHHSFNGSWGFDRQGAQTVTCDREVLWVSVMTPFGKHSIFLQEALVLDGSFTSPLGLGG